MEFIIVVLMVVFYFLPSIVGRNHKNVAAIMVTNLLFGWTLIGWAIALIWALTESR